MTKNSLGRTFSSVNGGDIIWNSSCGTAHLKMPLVANPRIFPVQGLHLVYSELCVRSRSSNGRASFGIRDVHSRDRRYFGRRVALDFVTERPRRHCCPNAETRIRAERGSANFTNDLDEKEKNQSVQLYGKIERVIADTAKRTQGTSGDAGRWEEIQGVWVIRPSKGEPRAVVHFVGGVFVGATPQLTYRLFLERLSERGFLVVATPFASGFDHLRIADEIQFRFDRCMRDLRDDIMGSLPVFGLGHSFGSLALLLVGARYAVQREGNVLMSFNNKEASRSIPLFSPVIIPMAQNIAPIIAQLTTSPAIRLGADFALKQLQSLSPPLVKQILPLVEQLPPLYNDLASGKDKFTPSPEETSQLVKSYYGVGRNLLIKFKEDTIDETSELARMLSFDSAVSDYLDMSVRTLPGDHTRPLQQVLPEVPPGMIDAFARGSILLGNLGALAANTPFANVAKEMGQSFPEASTMKTRAQIIEDIEKLVNDLASWMFDAMR